MVKRAAAILVLLAATAALHAWSLADGSILDDHWHQQGLRDHGWSYGELMRSLEIEPADFQHLWWQDRVVRWEYGRPLFILAMKFVYRTLGGDDPAALHLFSLLLHAANVLLVAGLAWRLTGRGAWGWVAGLLLAVYPHSVITVAWPSSQNAVIVTFLMLLVIFLYWRAASWPRDNPPGVAAAVAGRFGWGWFLAALLVWAAALLTRENALMTPAILVLLEWRFGGLAAVWRRRAAYGVFALLGLAFIAWRLSAVTHPMPDVYVRRPDGDWAEYGPWLAAKALHYVVTSIWVAPMTIGPTGRFNPWLEAPGDCALMVALLLGVGGGYAWLSRATRGAWAIWPAWIGLGVLPVIPMIATPHSGYIPGVGFVLAVAVAGAAAARSVRPWEKHAARSAAWFFIVSMSIMSMFTRWQWSGVAAAERLLLESVEASPPGPEATDVYFINLPFVNVYAKPALDRRLGARFEPLRVHVLNYAADPIVVDDDVFVEQRDDFTLRVTAVRRPYFSRLLGRFLIEPFRAGGPFRRGEVVRGDDFDVTIVEADAEGVWSLEFRFARSLDDPRMAFYVTTPYAGATPVRFECGMEAGSGPAPPARGMTRALPGPGTTAALGERLRAGDSAAAEPLFAVILGDRSESAAAAEILHEVAGQVAGALGAVEHGLLTQPRLSAADWERVREFWRRRVDDQVLGEAWVTWEMSWRTRWALEEVPNARIWAGKLIRTDMYLTGRPFPGPRSRPGAASRSE